MTEDKQASNHKNEFEDMIKESRRQHDELRRQAIARGDEFVTWHSPLYDFSRAPHRAVILTNIVGDDEDQSHTR